MTENQVNVVVTGTAWMGSGIGSIESALERIFREAEREIALTIYSITSGADALLAWLETALARGLQVQCVINRFEDQPADVCARLLRHVSVYPHFYLYNFSSESGADLHAKTVVADRKVALVGSSNMSRRGFLLNHEIAVLLQGRHAEVVASVLDRLFDPRYTVGIRD